MPAASSPDEEIILEALAVLEDLLYEPVSLGGGDDDDEWNVAETKDAATFRDDLERFESRALSAFASGEGEYGHDQHALHAEFRTLVEDRVERALEDRGFTPQRFLSAVRAAMDRDSTKWQRSGAQEVVALLSEVCDFRLWASDMIAKAQRRRHK
ncbi:hypothetical protein M885DRAFT_523885 [Pelagophyceae sp. CCMP2097]|nr:hypothetical protein M885DRAFT_523885 [Pelagophyceae sp. CCMP2097]